MDAPPSQKEEPHCGICRRKVFVNSQDFGWSPLWKHVGAEDACVHIFCWVVRANTPATRAIPAAAASKRARSVAPVDGMAIVKRVTADEKTCVACQQVVLGDCGFFRYVGCDHALVHIHCAQMKADITRRLTCVECAPPESLRTKEAQWLQRAVDVPRSLFSEQLATPGMQAVQSFSVLDAVLASMPAAAIVATMDQIDPLGPTAPAYTSSMRQLVHEISLRKTVMAQQGYATSALMLLRSLNYTAADMLVLGLTLPIALSDDANRDVLLDPTFFPASEMVRRPLHATFLSLVIAGVDVGLILEKRHTERELQILQFNVPACRAAGLRYDEFTKLNLHTNVLYTMFCFTKDVQDVWVKENAAM